MCEMAKTYFSKGRDDFFSVKSHKICLGTNLLFCGETFEFFKVQFISNSPIEQRKVKVTKIVIDFQFRNWVKTIRFPSEIKKFT